MPKDTKSKKPRTQSDTAATYAPAVIIIMVAVTGTVFAIIGYLTAMSTVVPVSATMPEQTMHMKKAPMGDENVQMNNSAPRNW